MARARLLNVLLVEDDEVDIENVQRAFDSILPRVQLHIVHDGLHALRKLIGGEKEPALNPMPELIILDLNMPKMNGIEFLRVLRANHEFDKIKVLILTTSDHSQDRTEALNLNILGYLVKPVTVEQMIIYCERLIKD